VHERPTGRAATEDEPCKDSAGRDRVTPARMVPNLKIPTPVSLVYAAATPPLLVKGRCVAQQGAELTLEVPEGTDLPAGHSVIVDFSAEAGVSRVIANVRQREGTRLQVKVTRVPTSDKREYPRMNGGITLKYFVIAGNNPGAVDNWLQGGKAEGKVFEPDPFMNFSVTGLAFDDLNTCADGDTLAFTLSVPGAAHTWRGAAQVVRIWKIPIDERDESIPATHRIAVQFSVLPDEAAEALRVHTERIQEAWL